MILRAAVARFIRIPLVHRESPTFCQGWVNSWFARGSIVVDERIDEMKLIHCQGDLL
jgi:aminoglycoside phosphotransferase family enzyme